MPRKPHEPTDKSRSEVEALSSFGVPQDDIAKYVGLDSKTLRKHYRDELDRSEVKANAKIGQFLFSAASGKALENGASHSDCVRAAMFWAKTRMGWRETAHIDHSSTDGSMRPPQAIMTTDPIEAAKEYQRIMGGDD